MGRTTARTTGRNGAGIGRESEGLHLDRLRLGLLGVHCAIIAYVSLGWLVPARPFLYAYLLVLPSIVLQWLLNKGSSIVSNFENVVRKRCWNDPANCLEGAFFRSFLERLGIRATGAQITTVCCSLMAIFWIEALCRLVLIVVPAPGG
jgi:hypothetical protein